MGPALVKAMKLATVAKKNGWHGSIESEKEDGTGVTVLKATRNDEAIAVYYRDNTMFKARYKILDSVVSLHCPSLVIEKLEGWPDLLKLFKQFPDLNRPKLVEKYRRLPFSFEDSNDVILERLVGKTLFWYSHTSSRLDTDIVLVPRKNTKAENFRIVDVGHRKLFHFIGAQNGFRTVILDSLIKVG